MRRPISPAASRAAVTAGRTSASWSRRGRSGAARSAGTSRSALVVGGRSPAIIWPLLAAEPKICGSNGIDGDRLALDAPWRTRGRDFRPLRHADLVEAVQRRRSLGRERLQQIEHVLGVAQVGEVGRGHDQNVVGADQGALGPARPLMRQRRARCRASSRAACRRSTSKASAPKS